MFSLKNLARKGLTHKYRETCHEMQNNICLNLNIGWTGAHFTNDFSITIQIWWKFH